VPPVTAVVLPEDAMIADRQKCVRMKCLRILGCKLEENMDMMRD
jgi:hypothetical protein